MQAPKMCLSPTLSTRLWWSSWIHAPALLVALSLQVYDLALLAAIVLFTSLNYWRSPDYGCRRYIDIISVQVAVWWLGCRNIDALEPNRTIAFLLATLTTFVFMLSVRLHSTHMESSTTLHSLVHLLGNLGSVVVYMGHLPPFYDASVVRYLSLSS
jgi:hypothetical protein